MWLRSSLPRVSRFVANNFYRFRVAGKTIPSRGAALLVANHPNAIADPISVAAAAGRPVRFLAKAPLFGYPLFGRLIRAVGAIPVNRRKDDPAQAGNNDEMFRAVQAALNEGDAVGIFPEGISHSDPYLAPLRTGAARIALGTAELRAARGEPAEFPIIPIGLNFHQKERYRSRSVALIGEPVHWTDLGGRGENDTEAVLELTARIDRGLRDVTVNLEQWEDAAVVECAEAIFAAEQRLPRDHEKRIERLGEVTETLARLRATDPERLQPVMESIARFAAILQALKLRPGHLEISPRLPEVALWTARRLAFFLIAAPLLIAGVLIFFIPYQLVGIIAARRRLSRDVRATVKIFAGAVIFLLWMAMIAATCGFMIGIRAGILAAIVLPMLALVTRSLLEHWRTAIIEARRYLMLRSRSRLRDRLLERRAEIAREIEAIWREGRASSQRSTEAVSASREEFRP